MRRRVRWFLGLAGSLGVLVCAAGLSAVTGVDGRAHRGTPYHAATLRRLAAPAGLSRTATGPLRAGFARVRLTPTLGAAAEAPERGEFRALPLAGFGSRRGRPAEGVRDELWVRAVALAVGGQTNVLVGADALIIPREVSEAATARITAETGLVRGQVYFGATHTHGGLGGWGEGWVAEAFAGGYQPGVRVWFAGQLAAAVRAALADLTPADLGTGRFDAPDLVRNRLVGDAGRLDPQFSFLQVRQADGDLAVVGSYAAHATVVSSQEMRFHGDYPGAWERAMEHSTRGLAVFLAASVGSHSPKAPAGGYEGAVQMGEELARRTREALATNRWESTITLGRIDLPVDLPELHPRVTAGLRLRPAIARHLLPVGEGTRLQGLRVGDSLWLGTPCDYSGELTLELRPRLAGVVPGPITVTSFNGDYLGYVIPSRYYPLDGYEPRTMSFFGPAVPDYFQELLETLGRQLFPNRGAEANGRAKFSKFLGLSGR